MLKRVLPLLLLLAFSLPAVAFFHGGGGGALPTSITIANFNGVGMAQEDQITKLDVNHSALDAHGGMTLQVGSTFYFYGDSNACGFVGNQASPYCGIKVYSSTDFTNWTYIGFLFDPTTTFWQDRCKGGAGGYGGCYRGHMLYNQANNNYVFWFNQGLGSGLIQSTDSYFVYVCATPYSGCVKQTDPSGLFHGNSNGDFSVYTDAGNAYIAYSSNVDRHIRVQALNANFTDGTGPTVDTGVLGEAVFTFVRSGTYYVGYGVAGCAYCSSNDTSYVSAPSPLGTYGSPVTLNTTSCGGQPRAVDVITAGGTTTYLYSVDLWDRGNGAEGLANFYFQPLSFTGAAVNPYTCNTTVTVPGLALNPPPPPSPAPDQSSMAGTVWGCGCLGKDQAGLNYWRMQTFVATSTTLTTLDFPLGQGCNSNTGCFAAGFAGNLTVSITTVDGSNNPVTTLGSVSLTSAQLPWTLTDMRLTFNLTGLTIGATYGIVAGGSSATNSGVLGLHIGLSNPYPAGVQRWSSDGGVTWNTEANRALLFSTYP